MESTEQELSLLKISSKGRLCLLSFSDGFEIRATRQVIERLGLTEGARFTPETYAELKRILQQEWAVYSAESLLSRRPFSIGLFVRRMTQTGIAEPLIRDIVRDFKARGLLNDYQYAVDRARSFLNRKPVGRGYLLSWLQNQLVPRDIAEKAVSEILADVDEVATAVKLLEKKRLTLAKFDLETARQKAYTYLSRRAISYGAAKEAFDRLFGKSDT